jgi:hypothetical protein
MDRSMLNKEFFEKYISAVNNLLKDGVRSKCYSGASIRIEEDYEPDNSELEFRLIYSQDKERMNSSIKIEHCLMRKKYNTSLEYTRDMFYEHFLEACFELLHRMIDFESKDLKSYSISTLIKGGL